MRYRMFVCLFFSPSKCICHYDPCFSNRTYRWHLKRINSLLIPHTSKQRSDCFRLLSCCQLPAKCRGNLELRNCFLSRKKYAHFSRTCAWKPFFVMNTYFSFKIMWSTFIKRIRPLNIRYNGIRAPPRISAVVQSTTPRFPREKTARAPESHIASSVKSGKRKADTV